jgi:dGTPase
LNAQSTLAGYAADDACSRGRRFAEPPPEFRSEFQRDRDRIIHSTAFRRLVYKTQVFVNHEGDLYRTRLTHSIEVAQIGRTVARALGLNEFLTEAICLAHDLGHTPFGHAGQDALNACMRDYGGFEHNLQSLRVVDELEEQYAAFAGLNLTFETREGILKHCSVTNARQLGELGRRFLERKQPCLEAQVADLADAIAYNNHDVDDGLRAGLLNVAELCQVALFAREHASVLQLHPNVSGRQLTYEIVRRMIGNVVGDTIRTSQANLQNAAPADVDAVRAHPKALIAMSEPTAAEHLQLKQFLRRAMYQHHRVLRMTEKAATVVTALFDTLLHKPQLLPPEHQLTVQTQREQAGESGAARAVADYIAGMTDRFAISEHRRLFDPAERS